MTHVSTAVLSHITDMRSDTSHPGSIHNHNFYLTLYRNNLNFQRSLSLSLPQGRAARDPFLRRTLGAAANRI